MLLKLKTDERDSEQIIADCQKKRDVEMVGELEAYIEGLERELDKKDRIINSFKPKPVKKKPGVKKKRHELWSAEETARLQTLKLSGFRWKEIGELLDRPWVACQSKWEYLKQK